MEIGHGRCSGDRPVGVSGRQRRGTPRLDELTDRTCREIGFLCVTGHRVPQGLDERLYALSKEFFRREAAEKTRVAQPASDIIRGYVARSKAALATTVGETTPPDLKETFSIGQGHPRAGAMPSWSIGMQWGGFRPR